MKLEILNQNDEKASFVIRGINAVTANTVRRLILESVPVLAIEEVKFVKNSSALYDEMLSHRLGLIPLKTDLKSYNLREECKCEGKGCSLCTLTLTLKEKGPCTVYAESLKSADPKAIPVFPKMPLVKLLKNQPLEFEATAVLGSGKEHAKFIPALVYYKAYPKLNYKQSEKAKEIAASCPVDILVAEGNKIKVTDATKCTLCMACEDVDSENVKVEASEEDFIFYIETFGQLSIKEILLNVTQVLDKKLNEFEKLVKKLK